MKTETRCNSNTICWFILIAFLFCSVESSMAQSQNGPPKDQSEGFGVAPIPIIEPVTEEGAGLALTYRYHLNSQNKDSSSSSTAFGGFVTGNRSWAAGVAQRFFFHEDKWRVRLVGSYADVRYNFYGIGTSAGDSGISVLMDQKGFGALAEASYRFGGLWYVGGQYRFLKSDSSFRPNPAFDASVIRPAELNLRTASLGPIITRDSRSDTDYPRSGSLLDLHVGFSGTPLGGEITYQTYDVSYSKYISVTPTQVLAVRGVGCRVGGSVPFFDHCLLTASKNLRGYRASRYRDRTMLASQAEYRWEAWKRLGFVAFGGAGEVAPRLQDFTTGNILPGGGVGVRYRFTRESHVNIRIDHAWGKSSHETYFFIGEVF